MGRSLFARSVGYLITQLKTNIFIGQILRRSFSFLRSVGRALDHGGHFQTNFASYFFSFVLHHGGPLTNEYFYWSNFASYFFSFVLHHSGHLQTNISIGWILRRTYYHSFGREVNHGGHFHTNIIGFFPRILLMLKTHMRLRLRLWRNWRVQLFNVRLR